ncbi:ferredoxin-NADP+ reductase [Trypanosoma rangeli]|uniref:NADPH:adrenodoxin oxidoreductase, mitochondrial n=1 Tax=Trypanosoma rangeli TaxID=5698 RepID=A0A422MZJ3_TRYRA|nr:ferredoxin-NADP+ reductase [Trypanosoma rangeli]RNE98648.1 ferredoxin-NADP+ reductase [Trypanosoma rangeli]|eukprot:RNE98648.1 ferredoxin-NADP+ reductase [Trypanosoma rangeli]
MFFSTTRRLSLAGTAVWRQRQQQSSSLARRIQIAVVGSGPSGCYVARLLTKQRDDIHVDVFERLPVPFGLCRYGVAPDHPEVKNVEHQFLDMFKSGRVTWIGNVAIGKDISIETLLHHYTAVVVATGADASRKLHIPGEELGGVVSAGDFVRYYNTYPFPHGSPRFCPFDLATAREAVIVGNGNVALDCARVLAASYKYFCETDMNCVAIRELMKNQIRRISLVARRGHAQSAFTIAEFRELTRFHADTVRVVVDPFDLQEALRMPAENPRARKRLLELVSRFTDTSGGGDEAVGDVPDAPPAPPLPKHARGPCVVHLRYHLTPLQFLPHPDRSNHVGAVVFERTDVAAGQSRKPSTTLTLPCDVAITSVGYRSYGVPGVAFDDALGVIPHQRGRVTGQPRLYCAGWVKRGAKGVIVQALMDAQETVASICEDLDNNVLPTGAAISLSKAADRGFCGKYGLIEYFVEKRLEPVSVAGLQRIFHVEKERGIDLGKRLEKIDNVRGMLDVALGGDVGKKTNNAIRGITNERPDTLLYLNELLDETTDLAPLARQLAKEVPPLMVAQHPPGGLHPSQL